MEKRKCSFSLYFFSLEEIPKINICHMVAREHPEVIEGRRRLIAVDVLDSEEAAEDTSIDHDGAVSDKEDGSGLLGAGVTKHVEDMQKALKYYYLLSYMLKPSHLVTCPVGKNKTAQEKLFKHMCNFGAQAEWREGRIFVISYLDVDTTKYQFRLLNPTTLDCIEDYIMEDAVGDRDLKRLPQRRLKFIDGSISSYCSILNSPEQLEHTRQANRLSYVLCDLDSDCIR